MGKPALLMNTLLCAAWQTDRIGLPSAINRIQIANYSWTHERVNQTPPEAPALLPKVQKKKKKKKNLTPILTWLLKYDIKKHKSFQEPQNYFLTDHRVLFYQHLSENSQRRKKINIKLIFLVSSKG